MADSPMRRLVTVGHRPHPIDRKRYGQARFGLYWASRDRFVKPGLTAWIFRRHITVVPVPKKRHRS